MTVYCLIFVQLFYPKPLSVCFISLMIGKRKKRILMFLMFCCYNLSIHAYIKRILRCTKRSLSLSYTTELALSKSKANLSIVTTSPPSSKLGQSYQTALVLITVCLYWKELPVIVMDEAQLIQSIWRNGRSFGRF